MSETPQPKTERTLTDDEIAKGWSELDDRVSALENGGGDRNTAEQLRLLRLMRTERHSYEMFANNFSGQAEALLRQVDEVVEPKLVELEAAAETSLAGIRTAAKKAEGDKKLYLQLHEDAQKSVAENQKAIEELRSAQDDLRTMINSTMKKWNEQSQQIKASNIERYAEKAAKEAFDALSKDAIEAEVARQVRQLMKAQQK